MLNFSCKLLLTFFIFAFLSCNTDPKSPEKSSSISESDSSAWFAGVKTEMMDFSNDGFGYTYCFPKSFTPASSGDSIICLGKGAALRIWPMDEVKEADLPKIQEKNLALYNDAIALKPAALSGATLTKKYLDAENLRFAVAAEKGDRIIVYASAFSHFVFGGGKIQNVMVFEFPKTQVGEFGPAAGQAVACFRDAK